MAWVVIACTSLMIVRLGGGKKFGQIILGSAALIGGKLSITHMRHHDQGPTDEPR